MKIYFTRSVWDGQIELCKVYYALFSMQRCLLSCFFILIPQKIEGNDDDDDKAVRISILVVYKEKSEHHLVRYVMCYDGIGHSCLASAPHERLLIVSLKNG